MNRVTLFGNLGADPELRSTSGGQAVLKMRLATSERYKDKSEQWQERTEWHNVIVWGKRAEGLSRILSKGSTVLVEGSLRTSSYDKGGEKRYKTEVVASELKLAGGKRTERDDSQRHPGASVPAGDEGVGDDDIPF